MGNTAVSRFLGPCLASLPTVREFNRYSTTSSIKYGTTDDRPTVTVHGQESDSHCEFQIVDHGPGIPADLRDRVFLPFERLASDKEGTGIGLAIVEKIVDNEGGSVAIEETPGGGVTFRVTLPKPQ